MIFDSSALPYILRAEDVAAVLRISRSSAYALMKQSGFPRLNLNGSKAIRVRREDLMTYLSEHSKGGA